MKLSIIIISYNEKDFLPEAIESCLNQKLSFPYEIIVGDDGSNDGSQELISEYENKYPDIIKSFAMPRNITEPLLASIRVSNVIKKGISLAEGDYCAILSGDDRLTNEDVIEKEIEFLDSHEKIFSCYCNYRKFWSDGNTELKECPRAIDRKTLWAMAYIHISCFLFRRCEIDDFPRMCDDTGGVYIPLEGKNAAFSTSWL